MKKFLRRLGWTVLTLIILVLVFVGEENWRGKHAWEKYRHERETMGDSFELSAIVPPPVPDADNFAAIPAFVELFPKPPEHPRLDAAKLPDCVAVFTGNWRVGRVENLAVWQKCFSNDNLLVALAKYDPILSEIAEASRRPKCRFPIRYEENFQALLPHLSYMRSLARTYRLRAQAELAAGQGDAAVADVQTCLRLADSLDNDSLLISFLVRAAVFDIAIQPVWEGLAAHRWSDAQLAILQSEFARADQFNACAKALHGERVLAFFAIRSWIDHPEVCNAFESNALVMKLLPHAVPTGWLYQNLLGVERFYTDSFLPAVGWEQRQVSPRSLKNVDDKISTMRMTPGNVLCKMLLPSITHITKKAAQSQVALDQAAVACALERYRLAQGELPMTLDALVPTFIAKVPHDVIDGQPLRYRRTAPDQFVLYSVGWNETDDGGKVVLVKDSQPLRTDINEGDWVWSSAPQDAMAVESK